MSTASATGSYASPTAARLGLLNGLRGQITDLDVDKRAVTIRAGDGSTRVVPARYLDAGHLDHGYAITIHKAQGVTVDAALVYATDGLNHEAAYTALSAPATTPGLLRR